MALTNFVQTQVALAMSDFKRENNVWNVTTNAPWSMACNQEMVRLGANSIAISSFANSTTTTVSSSLFTAPLTEANLTDAYISLTDSQTTIAANREIHAQFSVADLSKRTHALGGGLVDQGIKEHVYRLLCTAENQVIASMYASGSALSGTSNVAVDYSLDTSSAANLLSTITAIGKGVESQNVPMGQKFMVLNPIYRPQLLGYGGSPIQDRNFGGSVDQPNSAITGEVVELYGFKFMFNAGMSTSTGVVFHPDRVIVVAPYGIQVEELPRQMHSWADFYRMRLVYGVVCPGKAVDSYAGASTTIVQHEGVFRITVA